MGFVLFFIFFLSWRAFAYLLHFLPDPFERKKPKTCNLCVCSVLGVKLRKLSHGLCFAFPSITWGFFALNINYLFKMKREFWGLCVKICSLFPLSLSSNVFFFLGRGNVSFNVKEENFSVWFWLSFKFVIISTFKLKMEFYVIYIMYIYHFEVEWYLYLL